MVTLGYGVCGRLCIYLLFVCLLVIDHGTSKTLRTDFDRTSQNEGALWNHEIINYTGPRLTAMVEKE